MVRRYTIELPDVFHKFLEQRALHLGVSKKSVVLDALRKLQAPPVRFFVPTPPHYESLADFVGSSTNLTIVGATLSTLREQDANQSFLRERVRQRNEMRFLLIDPGKPEGMGIKFLVEQLRRGTTQAVLDEIKKTLDFLQGLRSRAPEEGRHITILLLSADRFPMCGLTIVDPESDTRRMRVGLYFRARAHTWGPFLQLDASTDEGRRAYGVFHEYFTHLLEGSEQV